jgi:hypothetical protein
VQECSIDLTLETWLLDTSLSDHLLAVPEFSPDLEGSSELCRSMLVYHRGVGVATRTDFFLTEKFDIALEWLAYVHPSLA